VKARLPQGFESSGEYFFRHRITPLVPVNDLAQAEELKRLQGHYLDASGREWK
jgi:hypothetical protein